MNTKKTILPDGKSLVVYAFKGKQNEVPADEYCRNVKLLDHLGKEIWTIGSHPQNDTNITGVIVRGKRMGKLDTQPFFLTN